MYNICPLCKRKKSDDTWKGKYPTDPTEIQNQIINLEHEHVALREGQADMLVDEEEYDELCPMCKEIMKGINGTKDTQMMMDRINQQILALETLLKNSQRNKEV